MRSVHVGFYNRIGTTVQDNMKSFASTLFEEKVIGEAVKRSQDYGKVTNEFWAGLAWKKNVEEVEAHCLYILIHCFSYWSFDCSCLSNKVHYT